MERESQGRREIERKREKGGGANEWQPRLRHDMKFARWPGCIPLSNKRAGLCAVGTVAPCARVAPLLRLRWVAPSKTPMGHWAARRNRLGNKMGSPLARATAAPTARCSAYLCWGREDTACPKTHPPNSPNAECRRLRPPGQPAPPNPTRHTPTHPRHIPDTPPTHHGLVKRPWPLG